MIRIGKRREAYTFTDRVHPKEGIISICTGGVLQVSFLVLFLITSRRQGGLLIGVLGLLIFACAVFGIWIALKGLKKEDIYHRLPILGIILNGIVVIVSVCLYFMGLASNIRIG